MNYKVGLYFTYLVYLFTILGTLYAFLAPKVANAWLFNKPVEEVKVETISFSYQEGDKIPEFVIDELISRYATGTKAYEMKRTLWCESYYRNVQSYIIDKNGNREDSWGIAQINLYWNPSVTKDQALDPEFSIKWMAERWGKTKWYGWIKETDSCNIIYK